MEYTKSPLEKLRKSLKGDFFMIEMPSKVEGREYRLFDLEQSLKPIGYVIGGNWDYDHGYFDYKIDDEDGYMFYRVPFHAVDGQLDTSGCTVAIDRPFLLAHEFEADLDQDANASTFNASFNQFQGPEDEDAAVPDKYLETGKVLTAELESILL